MSSSLTKFKLVMSIILSFLVFFHYSTKQIKDTLVIMDNWYKPWDESHYSLETNSKSQNGLGNKQSHKLSSKEIWELETEYFLSNYRLDKGQGKIILSWLKKTFPDAPYMLYVARCESDELIHWKSINARELLKRKGGSDSGVLQVNGVHKEDLKKMGLNLNKIEDYFSFVRHLYDKKGVQPWYMSKGCWNKHYQRIKSYNT